MYRHIRFLLAFILLSGLGQQGWSKHIIGGDLQYECLGEGRYRITLKMYRDCREQEMAGTIRW